MEQQKTGPAPSQDGLPEEVVIRIPASAGAAPKAWASRVSARLRRVADLLACAGPSAGTLSDDGRRLEIRLNAQQEQAAAPVPCRVEVGHYRFTFQVRRDPDGEIEVAGHEIGEGWFEIEAAEDLFQNYAMRSQLHDLWIEDEDAWREVEALTRAVFDRLRKQADAVLP